MAQQVKKLEGGGKPVWSDGLTLAAIAAVCTTLVALTFGITKTRIALNEQAWLEQSLRPALAGIQYDNDLAASVLTIPLPHDLPGNAAVKVYRARRESRPVAALFVVSAPDGFAGPIRLLIGVDARGIVTATRVLRHRETPGLGDFIDSAKSDWIDQFERTSLSAPERERWSIDRDGGAFDQVTGASITSRAVVKAIKETLLYFEANRESIFAE